MGSWDCIVDIEGQRGFFQILLNLYERQRLLQCHLYNNKPHILISNNATAVRALSLLLKYDLVHEKKKEGSNAKYYQLTSKGKECAKICIELQELLIKN
jgi:hypothetical protein